MAKVTAPLLGFGASGTIAKTAVYAKWRGVSYARRWTRPANPQSTEQTITRETFAKLREVWKRLGADSLAPWNAFAKGRPFTGMNAFVGENMRLIRGEADLALMLGSPGAGGGLAFPTISAATGAAQGEVDVTMTAPTLPTGWTITKAVALGLIDQASDGLLTLPIGDASDAATPYVVPLTGFGSATTVRTLGWFVYVKPNGETAYSVSLNDSAVAGA
jgi:hypothetical protein